jgi:hypothetical protein
MVSPFFCRPILMITFWDVVCLLWAHYVMKNGFWGMSYHNKLRYLARMQVVLISKINTMELNQLNHPSTINLTISVEKEEIIRIMFGASVRSGGQLSKTFDDNQNIATGRVNAIPALRWCAMNPQIESSLCPHNWGHCSKLIPLMAMHRQRKSPATLYCRTIDLKHGRMRTILPCAKCSRVIKTMKNMGIATIYPF